MASAARAAGTKLLNIEMARRYRTNADIGMLTVA
jgi:hypothetical protein